MALGFFKRIEHSTTQAPIETSEKQTSGIFSKVKNLFKKKVAETTKEQTENSGALRLSNLMNLSPEFVIKTFVLNSEDREEITADLEFNQQNNTEEKAQIMLLYQLFKKGILPLREEDKNELTKLFRGEDFNKENIQSIASETETEDKEAVLVGAGITSIEHNKNEKQKNEILNENEATNLLNYSLKSKALPVVGEHDVNKVFHLVSEFVTSGNDKAGIRDMMKHIPEDSASREAYLQKILYALHATGLVNFDTDYMSKREQAKDAITEAFSNTESKHVAPVGFETVVEYEPTQTIEELKEIYAEGDEIPLVSLGDANETILDYILQNRSFPSRTHLLEAFSSAKEMKNAGEKTTMLRSILYQLHIAGEVYIPEEQVAEIESKIYRTPVKVLNQIIQKNVQ